MCKQHERDPISISELFKYKNQTFVVKKNKKYAKLQYAAKNV